MGSGALGYVYILGSSQSSYLKIGFTTGSVEQRALELHTTGMAHPLEPIFYVAVEKPFEVEQLAHHNLQSQRVVENREFFDCDLSVATAAIRSAAEQLGIEILKEWSNSTVVKAETEYDISGWPAKAQEVVNKIINQRANLIAMMEYKGEIVLRSVPPDDCKNFNLVYEWINKSIEVERSDRESDGFIIPDQVDSIKYCCGARSYQETDANIVALNKYLARRYLSTKTYQKIYAKRRHFQSIVLPVYTDIIENVKQSAEYRPVLQRVAEIDSFIADFELRLLQLPSPSNIDIDNLIRVTRILSKDFGSLSKYELERDLCGKLDDLRGFIEGDPELQICIEKQSMHKGVNIINASKLHNEIKDRLNIMPRCESNILDDWRDEIWNRFNLIFETAKKIESSFSDSLVFDRLCR